MVQNRPVNVIVEREPWRNVTGQVDPVDIVTVFLKANRCPVGCSMCDLHHQMLDHPTPPGSIPEQIRFAVREPHSFRWIKLYNSGNFFDPTSIPRSDYSDIIALCQPFERIVVENHPLFGQAQHERFADALSGRLEIAVGLETVHPRWLSRLGKRMSRDQFDRYALMLESWGIDLRVFLMVGAPGQTFREAFRWAKLSVRHAISVGARHISLIPARPGEGWRGQADRLPQFDIHSLTELFCESIAEAHEKVCLSIDLWNLAESDLDATEIQRKQKLEIAILNQDSKGL